MGYSKSRETVKKQENKELLNILLHFKDESEFKIPTSLPTKLASRCRELLAIIEESPKSFPEYANLTGRFSFHIAKDSIIVRRKHNLVTGEAIRVTPEGLGVAKSLVVPDCTNVIHVVGAAIKHKADEIVFPDCDLNLAGLFDLHKWTSKNNYFFYTEPVLTLTRTDSDKSWKLPT